MILILIGFVALVGADITGQDPPVGTCVCLTHTGVYIRDNYCGNVIGTRDSGCWKYTGDKQACDLSGTTYEFFATEYPGQTGYIAGDFLDLASDTSCASIPAPGDCASVEIIPRSVWGARPPAWSIGPLPSKPVEYGFVHHSVTPHCYDQAACETQVRGMQNYHMDSNGWPDIAYNFLVGEDGRAYEGRGWDKIGAHTFGHNEDGIAVCTIGDFTSAAPNQAALDAINNIFNCAVQEGVLASDYKMYGHRDAGCTACPGDSLYPVIQTWPQYSFDPVEYFCKKDKIIDEV